ncbi:hypothetical protein QFC20_006281 [Naganishia adeliensis]|uniref:Uncharacterized protein n=1 Tax=Naganishia adeliensis TaxID=92952 RepID=A0ACC2VD04_9TREE|nr:hypothetical protein QFC20_006281 [Naganishia adeliensis]
MLSLSSLFKPLAFWKRNRHNPQSRKGRDVAEASMAPEGPLCDFEWSWEIPDWPSDVSPTGVAKYVRCQLNQMVHDMEWSILHSASRDKIILRLPMHDIDKILTILIANAPIYIDDSFIKHLCRLRLVRYENGGFYGKRFTEDLQICRNERYLSVRFGRGIPPTFGSTSAERSTSTPVNSSLSDSSPSGSSTHSPGVLAAGPFWEQI